MDVSLWYTKAFFIGKNQSIALLLWWAGSILGQEAYACNQHYWVLLYSDIRCNYNGTVSQADDPPHPSLWNSRWSSNGVSRQSVLWKSNCWRSTRNDFQGDRGFRSKYREVVWLVCQWSNINKSLWKQLDEALKEKVFKGLLPLIMCTLHVIYSGFWKRLNACGYELQESWVAGISIWPLLMV